MILTSSQQSFVNNQLASRKVHDIKNCLACNSWAWSDDDERPPEVHLWVKKPESEY